MHMKVIRKRRNIYAVLFTICICLTVWFAVKLMADAALIFGVLNIILLILLVRQSRLLYDANLIWNNCILSMSSAIIYILGDKGIKDADETVVSTFGILVGSKIYKWGCDGMYGVRLNAIEIDHSRIYLTFGDGINTMQAELLHGMVDEQTVMGVKQKLWHETGVVPVIKGW